jgi:magnesium transporter
MKNQLDECAYKLIQEGEHANKVLDLDNCIFVAIRVLKTEKPNFETEQMYFIANSQFLWSLQEKKGDYFGWVRDRLEQGKGIARKKKADYLLYLLMDAIIDNYYLAYQKYIEANVAILEASIVKPTPGFTAEIEAKKQDLFKFKRATSSLRDTITKLEKLELKEMRSKYYAELKDQVNNLISDIDFDLQELESDINLIFSIQGHRLNEVMKTLTIFSVIFIPLTFLAGIYGMNFKNMPELETPYGYFALLGVMIIVTLFSVWYFIRKKWF